MQRLALLELSDGRDLCWGEYGDSEGRPVFLIGFLDGRILPNGLRDDRFRVRVEAVDSKIRVEHGRFRVNILRKSPA